MSGLRQTATLFFVPALSVAAALAAASGLQAALVISSHQGGIRSFDVAADDLINAGSPSFSSQSHVGGSLYGSDITGAGLNNGIVYFPPPDGHGNTELDRTYVPDTGSSITFDLDVGAQPAGYTIGTIGSLSGGDQARRSQKFRLDYSLVGTTDFVTLADETQTEFVTNAGFGEMLVYIRDDTGAPLATGVDQIRVTYYPPPAALPQSMYRELDVFSDFQPLGSFFSSDSTLTDTSQIRAGANGNAPFEDNRIVAAVNFTNASPTPVNPDTILGIGFDDVNLTAQTPYNFATLTGGTETPLTANGTTATLQTRFAFIHPGNNDNGPDVTGTDAAAMNRLLNNLHVLPNRTTGAPGGGDVNQELTVANLTPNANVFVQLFGGDGGWVAVPRIEVNGAVMGDWTNNTNNPSQFNFYTTADGDGKLDFDFNFASGNFGGLAGFIITEESDTVADFDERFTHTGQLRTAPFGDDTGDVVAAVNFHHGQAMGTDTILGIEFDDVDLLTNNPFDHGTDQPPGSGDPGFGSDGDSYNLSANGTTATLETRFGFLHTTSTQVGTVAGDDAAAANKLLSDVHVIAGPPRLDDEAREQEFIVGNLPANRDVFVQLFGGDGGWHGDTTVIVNGFEEGVWDVSDVNSNTNAIFGFATTTDGQGRLHFDLNHDGNFPAFAGLSGLIITAAVPEPTGAGLLALGLIGLALCAKRRRP